MGENSVGIRTVVCTDITLLAITLQSGRLSWLRDTWCSGEVVPLISGATADELETALAHPGFELTEDEVIALLDDFYRFCELLEAPDAKHAAVEGLVTQSVYAQSLIDLAVDARAHVLVTEDDELLALNTKEIFEVLRPEELYDRLGNRRSESA